MNYNIRIINDNFKYNNDFSGHNKVPIVPHDHNNFSPRQELKCILQRRGPNSDNVLMLQNAIFFAGFVLGHQGNVMCDQPLESSKHVLLFNGDIFNLNKSDMQEKSDTEWIFQKLSTAETEDELVNCFRTIEGPFSLIFYDKVRRCIYFARDSLGRNSLLLENTREHIRILSTSYIQSEKDNVAVELPPLGIYKVNDEDRTFCTVFPWQSPDEYWKEQARILESVSGINLFVQNGIEPSWLYKKEISEMISYNFNEMYSGEYSSTSDLYDNLLKCNKISTALDIFSDLLENSVKVRVQLTSQLCRNCLQYRLPCNHSKIAILFSGGIDCSILALLADKYVSETDSIDLVNVAFESTKSESTNWNVPDRVTAKNSLDVLKKLCPHRKWNFIEVNVSRNELHTQILNHIKHLIYPLCTVLDESIGCAFWFASQGKGLMCGEEVESTARVVILGSGADELFGGYIRHKNAYNRCTGTEIEKEKCLQSELEKDWNRIPTRNLARDDRVISDSGKTPRAPFIEENVVKFARSLRPNQRCCFLYEDGVGDKLFLRLYGYRLGLKAPAFLKKRAIQFGSKIANKKENANSRSKYM